MDIYKFKPVPAHTNFPLPFELTRKDFSIWLHALENSSANERAHQIFLAIQSINISNKLAIEKKSLLLIDIYQAISLSLEPLKNNLLNSALPLTPEEQSGAEYIIWTYTELANGFASCISKKSNTTNAQTFFYGLQSLITAYLHISEIYEMPYANFWKQSYLFFGLASKLEIQDLAIKAHNKHSNTTSKAFKHLLALYHCDLHQFRPRAMLHISTCVEKYTSLTLLDTKFDPKKPMLYSGLDLNSDTPPSNLKRLKQTEKSAFYFFSGFNAAISINQNVNDEAQGSGIIKSINRELIQQASKSLSLQQKRQFTRIVEKKEQYGIMGLANTIQLLRTESPLTPPQPTANNKKNQTSGGWSVPDLELVSEGFETLFTMKEQLNHASFTTNSPNITKQIKQVFHANNKKFSDNTIWSNSGIDEPSENTRETKLAIADSSIKGYKIIFNTENNNSKIQIGDIIGIKHNDTVEIGLIRRVLQHTKHRIQVGIKLLSLESELAYISLPDHDSIYTWALFLSGIKQLDAADSLVFYDNNFQCGELIKVHRANQAPYTCRLQKLLHLSPAATHIQLSNASVIDKPKKMKI